MLVLLVVVLLVVSTALPVLGLLRLYGSARSESEAVRAALPPSGGEDTVSFDQFTAMVPILKRNILDRPEEIRLDLALIGIGVIAGMAANAVPLFVSLR